MPNKIYYQEEDLDNIFIRAKNSDGKWDSLSLNEVDDTQFVEWVKSKFGIVVKDDKNAEGTDWNKQQKVSLLNFIANKQGSECVCMVKREKKQ